MSQSAVPPGEYQSVATGIVNTYALRMGGTVVCFGWGQGGPNDAQNGTTFDHSGQAIPPPNLFRSLDAGAYFNCGITLDLKVICWGRGDAGQLLVPADFP